jgi:hypothetical protein
MIDFTLLQITDNVMNTAKFLMHSQLRKLALASCFFLIGLKGYAQGCTSPATVGTTACAGNNSLKAQTYNLGVSQFNWYTDANPMVASSPFFTSYANSSTTYNSSIYTANFSSTTTYYVSVICNGTETARTSVTFALQSVSISASQNNAPNTSVVLSASDGNLYNWYSGNANGYYVGTATSSITVTTGGYYYISSSSSTCTASVYLNYRPVSDAGQNYVICSSLPSFTIYGAGSDPQGQSLAYSWSQTYGPTGAPPLSLFNSNTSAVTVSGYVPGPYNLTLTVTDSYGASSSSLMSLTVYSCTNNYSYVQSERVTVPGYASASQLTSLTTASKNVTYNYQDGLGRVSQQVQWQGSPSGIDIQVPYEYDALGRREKSFLPMESASSTNGYFVANATGLASSYATSPHHSFYNSGSTTLPQDAMPYSDKVFESSPLGRVVQNGSPGSQWQPVTGKYTAISYGTNGTADVRLWTAASTGVPTSSGLYPAAMLTAITVMDEQGIISTTFTNSEGMKILTRTNTSLSPSGYAETYYVYDVYNNLRFVLPPEFIRIYPTNSNAVSVVQSDVDAWCYQMVYDGKGRLAQNKAPGLMPGTTDASGSPVGGVDWVSYVYDLRDRVVLTQDGNQRALGTWSYTKYDGLNRPVSSGIFSGGSSSQSSMQSTVDSYGSTGSNAPTATSITLSSATGVSTVIASQSIYL